VFFLTVTGRLDSKASCRTMGLPGGSGRVMQAIRVISAFETKRFARENRRMLPAFFAALFLLVLYSDTMPRGMVFELFLLSIVLVLPAFPSYGSFLREKSEGTIEAVLAAPVSPRELFWGKLFGCLSWGGMRAGALLISYSAAKLTGFILWDEFRLPFTFDLSLLVPLLVIAAMTALSSSVNIIAGIRARHVGVVIKISWIASTVVLTCCFVAVMLLGVEKLEEVIAGAVAITAVAVAVLIWRLPHIMDREKLVIFK